MFEFCLLNEYTINYFGISVFSSTTQLGIQISRHKPLTFILLLPGLIKSNAVFDAKLTYHSWPCLPTYLDIWFQVRLNLRPLWHSVCDVHSGNREFPCDLDWLLKLQAFSTLSFLGISHFIPWHLTLGHCSEFSEIAVEGKQDSSVWASLLNFSEIHMNTLLEEAVHL